jgi:tetratricopeptide (TPR) repeat protein
VTLGTDDAMVAGIKKAMDGPAAGDYYAAGRYYHEENKDPKQALEWVNKSLEKGGEKFWILRLKALLQAKMGDFSGAIATAEKSSELAKKENNEDYQRMNEVSVKEWKMKK